MSPWNRSFSWVTKLPRLQNPFLGVNLNKSDCSVTERDLLVPVADDALKWTDIHGHFPSRMVRSRRPGHCLRGKVGGAWSAGHRSKQAPIQGSRRSHNRMRF